MIELAAAIHGSSADAFVAPGAERAPWRVLKFGGTSVSTPERVQTLIAQVRAASHTHRVMVVVSALAGVTDTLEQFVVRVLAGNAELTQALAVQRSRHLDLLQAVAHGGAAGWAQIQLIARWRELVRRLHELDSARTADAGQRAAILALGERWSAPIVTAALCSAGIAATPLDAAELIVANGFALDAVADVDATRARLSARLRNFSARVSVVTGFLANDSEGRTVLLGRGGSDTTATLLGEALAADRVEIWTDVDGVFSADPRLLPEARPLPLLGYAGAASLARHGARVLHARSIEPAWRAAIPLHVRNSLNPAAPGTVIGPDAALSGHQPPARALVASAANDGLATVAIVARDLAARAGAVERVRSTLARADIACETIGPGVDAHAIVARVAAGTQTAALRALHARMQRPLSRVDVVLIGARGKVGTALRTHWVRESARWRDELGLDLRLVAAFDRRGFAHDAIGIDAAALEARLDARRPGDWPDLRADLLQPGASARIVIDVTAADDVADEYASLLGAGVGVVTANKRANARDLGYYRLLQSLSTEHDAPYRYETTVGAAIPVLGPLRDLRRRGERVLRIEGVLSGSLSYILARVHEGVTFSEAVLEAQALGYTEPDPYDDLGGEDLARKLVILAREAGFDLERERVAVQPLAVKRAHDQRELRTALATDDVLWRARAIDADAKHARLIPVVAYDGQRARVEVRAEPLHSPFARVQAGENVLRVWTEYQQRVPLTLSGPGAGPAITAAGVLSDLLAAAQELTATRVRQSRGD